MTDDEEVEECDGENCEDPYCEKREEYEVEFSITVKGTVMAHSEMEADELASAVSSEFDADLPTSFSEEWTESPSFTGTEYTLDSLSLQQARAADTAKWLAKAEADA